MDLIDEAFKMLNGKVRRTPIDSSSKLSKLIGTPAFLKLENLQITGSFKLRGALFYISQLKERKLGVACCSAGNHGIAVAYAAKMEGIPCRVYVPSSVDQAKHEKLIELDAKVIVSEFPGYDETLNWALSETEKNKIPFISAFDDPIIIAANGGTIAREIQEELPGAKNFILPIGGGGMAAGFASFLRGKRIICCQLKDSPAFALSLKQGKAVTQLPPCETAAGGIEGGIGALPFEMLKEHGVNEVCLLSEEEVFEGVRFMLQQHQMLVEPSSAVVIAAALFKKLPKLTGPTVFVISGRNVSYQTIKKIVSEKNS